jgi:molybdopterin-containing oxidoreductase family membrane subunit
MTMLESRHNRVLAWTLRGGLFTLVLLGAGAYSLQVRSGLGVTGLSREMPWGLYISQFTFLVGIGASAVTVILPYYVHRQKAFARALILGEIVAVLALCQALMCITVDLGKPGRILNVLLYASPSSMMFWDCLTLTGYLILSVVGLAAALFSRSSSPTKLMRVLALATIPWAIGIHVVTALLYAGLAARPAWMTAVLAPRFLATAFASGPALLILLAGVLARAKVFDIGCEAVAKLTIIMTYAAAISVLLAALEAFTALYSGIPTAREHLEYLFLGLDGHLGLVAWSYGSWLLLLTALVVLLVPRLRRRQGLAYTATAAVLVSVLIDKGLCLVTSGFVPSPLGYVRDYRPSLIELGIVAGIYAGGALVFVGACRWLLPSHAKAHEQDLQLSIDSTIHAVDIPPSTAREPGMVTVAQLEN